MSVLLLTCVHRIDRWVLHVHPLPWGLKCFVVQNDIQDYTRARNAIAFLIYIYIYIYVGVLWYTLTHTYVTPDLALLVPDIIRWVEE